MTVLPEKILRRMSVADRKTLGNAGQTRADCDEIAQAKNERELQKQIVNYLRLHGIEVNVSRTDKRTTHRKGWPDITFAASVDVKSHRIFNFDVACAWEIKFGKGKLSPEQEKLAKTLTTPPNCWRFRVIRSLEQAREELEELGIGNQR